MRHGEDLAATAKLGLAYTLVLHPACPRKGPRFSCNIELPTAKSIWCCLADPGCCAFTQVLHWKKVSAWVGGHIHDGLAFK